MRDIYKDLCSDEKPELGLSGSWQLPEQVGSCNACYSRDNRAYSGERVFKFRARSLEMRLCIGHLKELLQQSRYY